MFRTSIRELLLLTTIVAMGVGWWITRNQAAAREQHWRIASVNMAVRLATETGKPVELTAPDGIKSLLLGSR